MFCMFDQCRKLGENLEALLGNDQSIDDFFVLLKRAYRICSEWFNNSWSYTPEI